jgi:hypothetical protein
MSAARGFSNVQRNRIRWGGVALTCALLADPAGGLPPEGIGMGSASGPDSEHVVSHEEWAEYLVVGLGLDDALDAEAGPADHFSLLCADRSERATDAEGRRVPVHSAFEASREVDGRRVPGEPVRVVVDVPAPALYQVAVEGTGLQRWSVDRRTLGHVDVTALGVGFAPRLVPLHRGPHEFAAYFGRGAAIQRVEVVAFHPLCIAPTGGWQVGRPLTHGDLARTLVHAFGLAHHLPEDGEVGPVEGEDYTAASAWGGRTAGASAERASEGGWATAGDSPAEFAYRVRLDAPGLFSVLARLRGVGEQVWSIDGRYRLDVRPAGRERRFGWIHVATQSLGAGEHVIRALLPRGSSLDLIRVVRRRDRGGDYVDLLREMGFRAGAPGALVTRSAALRSLATPAFAELTDDFLVRATGSTTGSALIAVDDELEGLYSRPLSPLLPSEL